MSHILLGDIRVTQVQDSYLMYKRENLCHWGVNHWKDGNYLETQIWHQSQIRILYLRNPNITHQNMTHIINHYSNVKRFRLRTRPKLLFSNFRVKDFDPEFCPLKIETNQRNFDIFLIQFSKNFDLNFAIFRILYGQKYQNLVFWSVFDTWKYGYEISNSSD